MKIIFPCLLFLLIALASNAQRDGAYRLYFKEVNWSIDIPNEFQLLDADLLTQIQDVGEQTISEVYENRVPIEDYSNLFAVKASGIEYMAAVAKPYKSQKQEDWLQSVAQQKNLLAYAFAQKMPDSRIDTLTTREKVGGKTFERIDISIHLPGNGGTIKTILYTALLNGYDFALTIVYNSKNESTGEQFLKAWRSSAFGVKHPFEGRTFMALLDSGKREFKRQMSLYEQDFSTAHKVLAQAVQLQPNNTEARYFYGHAIDRMNMADGSAMHLVSRDLSQKASAQFEAIIKMQPKYTGEIIYLDPYSKLTAIWGSISLAYLYRNQPDSARWALMEGKKRGGFPEGILEFNRQVLMSCTPNAILLSYGDNSTMPLYYLQQIENYRTDVSVVDVNLLHSDWYAKFVKREPRTSLSYTNAQVDSLSYRKWEPTEVEIRNETDKTQALRWTLKPTYQQDYILKGDLILLDLFKRHFFKRDFYYATTYLDSSYSLFLEDYIVQDGVVAKVQHHKNITDTTVVELSENLKQYNINKVSAEDLRNFPDILSQFNRLRWAYVSSIN